MIDLHPVPEARHDCPHCNVSLRANDWYIPGMRNLAVLECPKCSREYYGDMPAGHGLLYPALLEADTGAVHSGPTGSWFAELLREGYADRVEESIPFRVEGHRELSTPVLVNALDVNYAHSILKLLHAQYYITEYPNHDVVAMIPPFLEWFVPDGVDQVWVIDQSLSEGSSWNEWLARRVHEELKSYDEVALSVMFPHTNHADFDIKRFSGVKPFPLDEWEARLKHGPTVTFVWRDVPSYGSVSRLWCSLPDSSGLRRRARGYINLVGEKLGTHELGFREQRRNILTAAIELRETFDHVDIGIAGVGDPGGFPEWITDLRIPRPNDEEERILCRRYAESHVVVGTHGSHMALPSAHAGAVVNIMPGWKRGNMGGDLLLRERDQRETMLLYRHVPASAPAKEVAREVTHLLVDWPPRRIRMQRRYCSHDADLETLYEIRDLEREHHRIVSSVAEDPRVQIGSDAARMVYEAVSSVIGRFR